MKTFVQFLYNLAEEPESDAKYNMRMRQNTRRLLKIANRGSTKRIKARNKIRRRPESKLNIASHEKAKGVVLKGKVKDNVKPSFTRKLVARFSDRIDRKEIKFDRLLKRQEPKRVKAARKAKTQKGKNE